MGVQTSYRYATPRGVAGGLYDLSEFEVNTRLNADTGTVLFGMGAVCGLNPGSDVILPAEGSTAEEFEGVVMNGFTTQQDLEGVIKVRVNQSVGVLAYGKAWIRVGTNAVPSYGEDVYLITDGEESGFFTTSEDTASKMKVPGRFLSGKDGGTGIAPAKFYHQKPESPASTPAV